MGDSPVYLYNNADSSINVELGKQYNLIATISGIDYTIETTANLEDVIELTGSWDESNVEEAPLLMKNYRLRFNLFNNVHMDLDTGEFVEGGHLVYAEVEQANPIYTEQFENDFEKFVISEYTE